MRSVLLLAVVAAFVLVGPSLSRAAEQAATPEPDAEVVNISGFNPNYLLLGADSLESNDGLGNGDCDIKFQLSFSRRITATEEMSDTPLIGALDDDSPLFFAFTQRAWWDICRHSSPFRETNYAPSLFWSRPHRLFGVDTRVFVGYIHESNGRDGDASTGWDRVFVRARVPFGRSDRAPRRWTADLALWEPFKVSDNNPDLEQFAGYGELALTYVARPGVTVRLTGRKGGGLLRWERGLGELDVAFPFFGTGLQMLVQYTNGYGTSLERFDQHEYAVRVGILFSDFIEPFR